MKRSWLQITLILSFSAMLFPDSAWAEETQTGIQPLGPEENAKQLASEIVSADALVSHKALEGLIELKNFWDMRFSWNIPLQTALINAVGPADPQDPPYFQAFAYHDEPIMRLFALHALSNFMNPALRPQLIMGEKVQEAIEAGHSDSIVSDELRRALARRLDKILDHSNPKYAHYETRAIAVELLSRLRNSKTDKEIEEDILYDTIMVRYLNEPSYTVRIKMLDFFYEPSFLAGTAGPEQFLCERVTDEVISDRERAMALVYLVKRKPHPDNLDLRVSTLITATKSADVKMRSFAVKALAELPDNPAATAALKEVLLNGESVYIMFLAGSGIRKHKGGKDALRSILPEMKALLTGNSRGKIFSPKLYDNLEKWSKPAQPDTEPEVPSEPEISGESGDESEG